MARDIPAPRDEPVQTARGDVGPDRATWCQGVDRLLERPMIPLRVPVTCMPPQPNTSLDSRAGSAISTIDSKNCFSFGNVRREPLQKVIGFLVQNYLYDHEAGRFVANEDLLRDGQVPSVKVSVLSGNIGAGLNRWKAGGYTSDERLHVDQRIVDARRDILQAGKKRQLTVAEHQRRDELKHCLTALDEQKNIDGVLLPIWDIQWMLQNNKE